MDWQPPSRPATTLETAELAAMSKNERIKVESQGLFYVSEGGQARTFLDEVQALDGAAETISGTAKELSKFFGIYKQQARGERGRKTDDYFFMVRIRNPGGGALSASQWLALDDAADRFGDGTLRITSRQGIQYHHVYGPKLAPLVRHLNRHYRGDGATLGACGDVNRNVMASPIDALDPVCDPGGFALAEEIATALVPRSSSYFQVFVSDDAGRNLAPLNSEEPVYGAHYLPRKFKIGIAHPRDNSIDLLTQDIGLLPVPAPDGSFGEWWDLYTGGGLGMSHNNPATAPLLGLHLGRIRRRHVVEACRAIAIVQRQNGERKDRKQARWKYTLRRIGVAAVRAELRERFGIEIEETPAAPLPPMQLHLGWHDQRGGGSWYGLSVENGRIGPELRGALRRAVGELGLGVRLTPQQDLLLCGVRDCAALEAILDAHGVRRPDTLSIVRRNAMACPAKPTCGLAMTEAEGVLPKYIDAIEAAGFGDVDAVIRMTGCPNHCARPPTAEIGIYGYGKNDHVILVGGSREGTRLGKTLFPRISGEDIVPALVGLFRAIREHNRDGLPVGEFLHRTPVETLRGWIAFGPPSA
jgi:sulfite reductase (ferredoxin)